MTNTGGAEQVLIAELKKRNDELEETIKAIKKIAEESPELNMINYDHDQVDELNYAMICICLLLEE